MTEPAEPRMLVGKGPYVGLDYFAEKEADFFFGRDAERKMIIGNLRASRLTLLYAQSGVGKSSLLRAGVAARLRAQAERNASEEGTPRYVPVVFNNWHHEPVAGVVDEIEAAAQPFLRDGSTLELPRDRLDEAIETTAATLDSTLLVMLDQFEEFFLYHERDQAGERFSDALARCVARDDLPVHVLISIREDVYSSIGDRFQTRIPNVYGNYLHLDYLDRGAARDAIRQPIDQLNRGLPAGAPRFTIGVELTDTILEQVRRGRSGAAEQGHATGDDGSVADGTERFETAYLELVMERLWDEEARTTWDPKSNGSPRELRLETLESLGGADKIIRTHVETALGDLTDDQRDAMAVAFRFLVTSAGRKIALTTRELSEFSGRPKAELDPALRHLERKRILRAVAAPGSRGNGSGSTKGGTANRWELFHDVLAEPVLSWRLERDTRMADERVREAEDEATRAKRRSLVLLALAAVALLGLVGAGISYLRAVDAGNERNSQKLAAAGVAALSSDPDESVRLALDGLDEADTTEAENALRRALPASRVRTILPQPADDAGEAHGGIPFVTGVSFGPEDELATGESTGRVRVWDWRAKRELVRLHEPDSVNVVQFADEGRLLLTATAGNAALWDVDRCTGDLDCKPLRRWKNELQYAAAVGTNGCVVARGVFPQVAIDKMSACGDPRSCPVRDGQSLGEAPVPIWLAFGEGSCVLAAITYDGRVSVWRASRGSYRATHQMSTGWGQPAHVTVSSGGHLIAAAGDRSFRVWDLRRCEVGGRGPAPCRPVKSARLPDWVNSISFDQDETQVVVTTQDGVARVWDLGAAEPLLELRGHRDTVFSAAFDSAGSHLATGSADGTARVWTVAAGTVVGRGRKPMLAKFMPGAQRILTASEDGDVHIYDRAGREEAAMSVSLSTEVTAAAASPDGRWLVTGTRLGELNRWNVRECMRQSACGWWDPETFGPENPDAYWAINEVAYDPTGRLVAIAQSFVGATILSADGEKRGVVSPNPNTVPTSVSFNPRGDRLVTTSSDGNARVWDVSECRNGDCKPRRVRTLPHSCVIYSATFSPDGRQVMTGCGDGIARIWTWADRDAEPIELRGHIGNVRTVAFSPDGGRAVTAGSDRTTRVWDSSTGQMLGVLQMHTEAVASAFFDPRDPKVILSGSDDGTARLYRCATCGSLDDLEGMADDLRDAVERGPELLHRAASRSRQPD